MHVYLVTADYPAFHPNGVFVDRQYCETRSEAHDIAKSVTAHSRQSVRVELFHLDTSKAAIVETLNGDAPLSEVQSTWRLSPRGGLLDCANGD